MKKFKKYVTVAGVIVGMLALNITSAFASVPGGKYFLRNVNSGLYLDTSNTTVDSGFIQQKWYTTGNIPSFQFNYINNEYCTIKNSDNLNFVATTASRNNKAQIQLKKYIGSDQQKWKIISNNDGTFSVGSKYTQGNKVMSVKDSSLNAGAEVYQFSKSGTGNDKWYFESVIEDGTYLIKNTSSNRYLTQDGHNISQQSYNEDACQLFEVHYSSNNGTYDIMPVAETEYSVEVFGWDYGSARANQEKALITASFGQSSEGQAWKLLLNSNGTVRIASQITSYNNVMTVEGVNNSVYSCKYLPEDPANGQPWESNGQSWELIRYE